jgi:glucosamine--fructose-6-phosphate aminotransferase (isomerizing)
MGEYIIEELSGVPVETDFSSEFRYRNSPIDDGTLVFVISQSGETVDSLAAMREVQRKGVKAFGLVNVVGSTIARESDGGVYLHAGPEIGVAAHQVLHISGSGTNTDWTSFGKIQNSFCTGR